MELTEGNCYTFYKPPIGSIHNAYGAVKLCANASVRVCECVSVHGCNVCVCACQKVCISLQAGQFYAQQKADSRARNDWMSWHRNAPVVSSFPLNLSPHQLASY